MTPNYYLTLAAGGMVLNVLKEELPDERESSFGAFAIGIAAYAVLLLSYSCWQTSDRMAHILRCIGQI